MFPYKVVSCLHEIGGVHLAQWLICGSSHFGLGSTLHFHCSALVWISASRLQSHSHLPFTEPTSLPRRPGQEQPAVLAWVELGAVQAALAHSSGLREGAAVASGTDVPNPGFFHRSSLGLWAGCQRGPAASPEPGERHGAK